MKIQLAPLCFLILTACGSLPKAGPPAALFDFGITPGTDNIKVEHVQLASVEVAPGLGGSEMRYRLAYQNPAQVFAYTESRWVASPDKLLQHALQKHLQVSGATQCALQVTVEVFDQVFDTPTSSRGVIQLRALLVIGTGRLKTLQSTRVSFEHTALSADARGGADALKAGAEEAVAAIVNWAGAQSCAT